jgi:hypothetical protein
VSVSGQDFQPVTARITYPNGVSDEIFVSLDFEKIKGLVF